MLTLGTKDENRRAHGSHMTLHFRFSLVFHSPFPGVRRTKLPKYPTVSANSKFSEESSGHPAPWQIGSGSPERSVNRRCRAWRFHFALSRWRECNRERSRDRCHPAPINNRLRRAGLRQRGSWHSIARSLACAQAYSLSAPASALRRGFSVPIFLDTTQYTLPFFTLISLEIYCSFDYIKEGFQLFDNVLEMHNVNGILLRESGALLVKGVSC
jgi:hypothetical protein